jgi:hypothetical protein
MRALDAARRIRRTLGKFFGSKQNDAASAPSDADAELASSAARAMAEYISGVEGSSLIWCGFPGCGEPLLPVVFSDGDQAELIALGCSHGHGTIHFAGVRIDDAPPASPTIH